MEEMKSEEFPIPGCDNGIMIIILKGVQELRENGKISSPIFVL
jgi:hypothetical protein